MVIFLVIPLRRGYGEFGPKNQFLFFLLNVAHTVPDCLAKYQEARIFSSWKKIVWLKKIFFWFFLISASRKILGVCGSNIFSGRVISIFFGRVAENFGYPKVFGYLNAFGYSNIFGYWNLAGYWNLFGYLNAYGGGGQNLERQNVERYIFQNLQIANIKMTKDELSDSFPNLSGTRTPLKICIYNIDWYIIY